MSELKPGWRRVKFGELADCVNDRVHDPSNAGVERYVGLEHLDSESLQIRRWGSPNEVGSMKLRFKPGDIIFGKRRAYQRKLAVADFEGICSAHAMVLRAKPGAVLPDFLPFFMQSDVFMERAIAISVGSLSPTINWKVLAAQEFLLPETKEQPQAILVLQRSAIALEATREVQPRLKNLRLAWLSETIEALFSTSLPIALGDLLEGSPEGGCSSPERQTPTGYWVLSLSALNEGGYVADKLKPVDYTPSMEAAKLHHADLLISRSNTRERVGFSGQYIDNGRVVSFPDTMMRLRPRHSKVSKDFLELLLQSAPVRGQIQSIAAGTSASMKKINRANLLKIRAVAPPIAVQLELVVHWTKLRELESAALKRARFVASIHQSLLSRVVSR